MPSSLSFPLNATVLTDDAASEIKANLNQPVPTASDSAIHTLKLDTFTEPPMKTNNVALSFAYDTTTKSLHVVMTDKSSGEVVRKMSYTHFPAGTHQSEQLHGLLLDQMV